ncbi:hypothetical protein [Ornithinibacillus bavariensis]|uniref:Uncharacterized protein n=1 Tax=Ornithinibacillus bavariensis TaxID=545502 RepID=A0A920C8V9_9BACI|nr:hypothetical protein [Ornithinibacillus bavariensis]GIO27987.1 hypothetical protein J43TS3_25980 [Ornithinibacillus bavariensis]
MKKILSKTLQLSVILTLLVTMIGPAVSLADSTSVKDELKEYKITEAFVTETLEKNKEGLWEKVGYNKVNSTTETIRNGNQVQTILYMIEDHYDLDGNFLKSTIKHEEFINDLSTGKALEKKNKIELDKPSTQLIENLSMDQPIITLSANQEDSLSKYLSQQVSQLQEVDYKETEGYTQEHLDNLVKMAKEVMAQLEEDNHLTAANGAYDNYYNTNNFNGNFTVQALSYAPQRYLQVTGNSIGNRKNADGLTQFQRNIDNYKEYIIRHMMAETYAEVGSWWQLLTLMITFAAGFSGPPGWVMFVSQSVAAFDIFRNMTSFSYATQARLSYSRTAAQYLDNATEMLVWTGKHFDLNNVKVTSVLGY